ncbi:CHASE2 domain-containing protein [Luteimonas sp. e5]
MRPSALRRLAHAFDGVLATVGLAFMDTLDRVLRGYRRPLAKLVRRIGFAWFPLLALTMVGTLAWDLTHARRLAAAEDAVFDQMIRWRPLQPKLSDQVAVVEIDDCSIEYFRTRGEGGWPWSRQRHADLIDALDRAGVQRVGFDVLFADASHDPQADAVLEAMAAAGSGRFMFASTRLHPAHDAGSPLHAAAAPGAWPLQAGAPQPGPPVAMTLPFGKAMTEYSGLVNLTRASDGLVRDIRLYEQVGDWAIPSLPLRLAHGAAADVAALRDSVLRINWRTRTQLAYVSAADLLADEPVCNAREPLPDLRGRTVLVGHTAAGINDAKPTPVNMAMPGVEVLAETTEALLSGNSIFMPPDWLKYLLAMFLVVATCQAFWRGEPHEDVNVVFVGLNSLLLAAAIIAINFGVFLDIFASIGFGTLCYGLCRGYASLQRGRVIGNHDYLPDHDPARTPWLGTVRLHFETDPALAPRASRLRRREYRRLLRRFLYRHAGIVMIEGVVERKHWMVQRLDDLVQLVWTGESEAALRTRMRRDLDHLHGELNDTRFRLDDAATVWISHALVHVDADASPQRQREQLRPLYQQDFNRLPRVPLAAANPSLNPNVIPRGETP